jgi:hypothetical protein
LYRAYASRKVYNTIFAIEVLTLKKSGAMCDPAGDGVTIWTRDGGKRLQRMIF